MADLQSLLDATAAQERIWAVPGVRRIGFGLKETAGEVQPRWVFRVYVDVKRPAAELQADELIPAEVEGFETDVLVDQGTSLECGGPRLHPGQQISTVVGNAADIGTLGCLVQKDGTFNILTCCHVINIGNKQEEVYQPSRSECLDSNCSKPVGKAGAQFQTTVTLKVAGEDRGYYVDCGLVPLVHGLSMENALAHGSLSSQIRDLSTENVTVPADGSTPASPPVTITKEGAQTGLTTGTVVEVCVDSKATDGLVTRLWYMVCKPIQGVHYSATFDIVDDPDGHAAKDVIDLYKGEPIVASRPDPTGQPNRFHFEGTRFSDKVDSGAIWYDGSGHPVGLHYAGAAFELKVAGKGKIEIPTGRGKAAHLTAVFSALGLDPTNGIVTGAKDSAGAMLPVPSAFAPATADLERELGGSEVGRELLAEIGRRQEEVRRLIDHDRRVTLVWHRHKGPAFVATAIGLARAGATEIPREVAGVRTAAMVGAMLDVLERLGSDELRETVARRRALLLELAEGCTDLDQVVAHLARETNSVV